MKLFGWKSAGRNVARPATGLVPLARTYAALGMGQWPQSYEAQLREGYLHNAIAQRAVRLVAEGLASAPLRASDDKARALVLATSGGQALLETLAGQLLLHGNGYVQVLSDADGRPCELYALRPERVSIEADARGWPAAFRYRVGETVTRLAANEVIHIRSHHPLDDHYGLGCLGAASGAIAVHNASAKWNKALLDNAARPSGALVAGAGEPMTGEQFARLKQELADGFQGAANAGRPMLLEGGLNWQAISLSPADMDFAGLKSAAAREIALAFGVPPMLLGLPGDATYANYREANKALWRQTILPLAGKMLDAIAEGLAVYFPALELSIDLDQLSALSEERERLWAQLGAADFLTLNEKREAIGLEALDLEALGGEEPEADAPNAEEDAEAKFNPWHDPDDGQFTFVGQGQHYGGSASSGATANLVERPKATSTPQGGVRTSDGRAIVNKPSFTVREPGINGKGYRPTKGDAHLLARIMYAETLSNPEDFEAIGWTIVNRVGDKKFRHTLNGVIRMPKQFESLEIGGGPKGDTPLWHEAGEPRKLTGEKRKGWERAFAVAEGILSGRIVDPTGGATFFMASSEYIRGRPKTALEGFFRSSLESGRLVDAPYVSTSKRKRQNHILIEAPAQTKPTKKRR